MLHGFGERAADAQNIAIAFGVAKPIIAMFEMADVNIGAGEGVAFVPELLDVTVESVAVAQVGERVDIGVALKQLALLSPRPFRHHLYCESAPPPTRPNIAVRHRH